MLDFHVFAILPMCQALVRGPFPRQHWRYSFRGLATIEILPFPLQWRHGPEAAWGRVVEAAWGGALGAEGTTAHGAKMPGWGSPKQHMNKIASTLIFQEHRLSHYIRHRQRG